MTILQTTRLRLEPFSEAHLSGLQDMNNRPEVYRFLSGAPETPEQTVEGIARVQRCWAAWGTSWWAFVEQGSGRIAGAGCVQYLRQQAALPPDLDSLRGNPLEIGWRLHPDFWHRGLATEAAKEMAAFAFNRFGLQELLAVRHPENVNSGRVMARLGMQYRGLEPWYGTSLATHVLGREQWLQAGSRLSPESEPGRAGGPP